MATRTASISRSGPPKSRSARVAATDPDVAEAHRRMQRAYLERASAGDRPGNAPAKRSADQFLAPLRRR